ncbi:hypothetical protein ACI78T_13170 [Blastococcus sp. SYSU D00922]
MLENLGALAQEGQDEDRGEDTGAGKLHGQAGAVGVEAATDGTVSRVRAISAAIGECREDVVKGHKEPPKEWEKALGGESEGRVTSWVTVTFGRASLLEG